MPQGFTINPDGSKQGAKESKEKGGHSRSRFKENENAIQEEDTLLVADQEEENPEAQPEGNTFMFAEDREQDDRSPIDFSTPLASFPLSETDISENLVKAPREPRRIIN